MHIPRQGLDKQACDQNPSKEIKQFYKVIIHKSL